MTIDEVIKELQALKNILAMDGMDYTYQAVLLAIEALKWRKLMEQDYGSWVGPLLPGEST